MPKKPRKQTLPVEDLYTQATKRMIMNRSSMEPQQFRDALTRAVGAVRGIPTQTTQWNNWTP